MQWDLGGGTMIVQGAEGLKAHRQMIFSVRIARLPTPSRSLRLSWSANHTSERSGVRSQAVSPSLFLSSGLAPRDRNNLGRGKGAYAWRPKLLEERHGIRGLVGKVLTVHSRGSSPELQCAGACPHGS